MSFEIGKTYTRKKIQRTLRGEFVSYLPQSNHEIVAGCFTEKMNPDAPTEIQVGDAPKVARKARELARRKGQHIPVFIKPKGLRGANKLWIYRGIYEFAELINDPVAIKDAESKSGRHNELAYLLRLKQVQE